MAPTGTPSTPAPSRSGATRRRSLAGALVLALVAGFSLLAAGPATAAQVGWIRVGHLAPGTPSADVELSPFAGERPPR